MFSHLLLGLLRDGQPRHGYQLITEYRARSGLTTNPGNVYRQLAKLVSDGLIEEELKATDTDPRRIPYRITGRGRDEFDAWLLNPDNDQDDLDTWLLFADMLPVDERRRLLERLEEGWWMRIKTLDRSRQAAVAKARRRGDTGYHPAQLLLLRRTKLLTADLEFLEEVRRELDAGGTAPVVIEPQAAEPEAEAPGELRRASTSGGSD